MNYAISKGMKVLATGAPYGWSNDVLQTNPNWAEGQHISGARFQANGSATQLQLVNSFPGLVNGGFESGKTAWFQTGDAGVDVDTAVSHSGSSSGVIRNAPANGRFVQLLTLVPWRQYHLRMYVKTQNYGPSQPWFLVFDATNSAKQRLFNYINVAATQDWTQVDATFNSQDSTQARLYFGEWGGSTGAIWFDDVSIEETALVNVLRRPGTPLKIYDPNTAVVFQEGKDYNFVSDPQLGPYPKDDYHTPPAVTLPAGTTLKPGQTVALDFYAVQPIHSNQTGMCLTEAGVQNWLTQNAQAVTAAMPASAGYFLQYDEMRHMNSCASCKAKGLTPGQLLAWHAGQTINLYQSLRPSAPIYVWSDMFDPYHNAHDNFYLVEGDIAGSWLGIPSSVTIMNWNLGDLKNSLTWFSGQNSQQPVAHRQIVAGYYDSGDGAGAAATELQQALGIPGVIGLMYTTWLDDYSQLKPFADAVKNNWATYQASVSASLSIAKTHTGSFAQGQQNATYMLTVSNAANARPSTGAVTVTETVPSGLTFVSMSGPGWTCAAACTRGDALNPGSSYPPITVTVMVAANATSPQINMVSVSGGGSAAATASDPTTIVPAGSDIGFLDMAGDAQGGATVAKGATLYVRGWAADTVSGAPVQSVTVFVDGSNVGTATLGGARPDVAQAFNRSDYTNSGWSFQMSTSALGVGQHSVTATAGTAPLVRTRTVNITSGGGQAIGFLDMAGDAQGGATLAKGATLFVRGWAADTVSGAPVQSVTVFVDGTSAGNATLGAARPDVAQAFNRSDYTNSGWNFQMSPGALSVGQHSVTAAAGTTPLIRTLTVNITSGGGQELGYVDMAGDAHGGSTVAQSGTLYVRGWAADTVGGAPVQSVTVFVDGNSVGNATLGSARADVAQAFSRSDYTNSGWSLQVSAGTLSVGQHSVTATATGSSGTGPLVRIRTVNLTP
jgi:uncharacterized repeat protein (TIGR01451 family)